MNLSAAKPRLAGMRNFGSMPRVIVISLLALLVSACGSTGFRAPVINPGQDSSANNAAPPVGGQISVQRGDSLYKIAKRYKVGLRALIDANRIAPPYTIYPGQKLNLPVKNLYVVARGDTVFQISERHGIEPGALVRANGIQPPYRLSPGQRLTIPARTTPPSTVRTASTASTAGQNNAPQPQNRDAPQAGPTTTSSAGVPVPGRPPAQRQVVRRPPVTSPAAKPPPRSSRGFIWPLNGKLIARYGSIGKGLTNDGVNIAARRGAPVRAVENGVVAYAGNELRGFGNLLLLKHADGWISAYAHNDSVLVKSGDKVARGQVISRVGSTGSVETPQLHFELRRGNRAVDPERYLGQRVAAGSGGS